MPLAKPAHFYDQVVQVLSVQIAQVGDALHLSDAIVMHVKAF
jgi:hypothetical protein